MPLPILFLLLVISAVVFAAAYALLGQPRTSWGKERQQEIISGFRIVGGLLVGWLLVGTFVVGAGVAFFGMPATRLSSRPLAFFLAAVSLIAIASTAQQWAKYFVGWLGVGCWGGLLMASSGHMLNNPAIPVRHSYAWALTALMFASAIVCLRFKENYSINMVDRIALVAWLVAFAFALSSKRYELAGIGIGYAVLVLAWLYYRSLGGRFVRHQRRFT